MEPVIEEPTDEVIAEAESIDSDSTDNVAVEDNEADAVKEAFTVKSDS